MEPPMRGAAKDKGPADMAGERIVNYFDRLEKRTSDSLFSKPSPEDVISELASPRSRAGTTLHPELELARKVQMLSIGEGSPSSVSISGGSLNRDLVLAKLNKEKVLSFIKAWEENMKRKSLNSYNKKVAKISAWEVAKRARVDATLRSYEESLENEKAACVEKAKNKVALVERVAEEQRARAEAHHGKEVVKAEEIATKCRASGVRPHKFIFCFSPR